MTCETKSCLRMFRGYTEPMDADSGMGLLAHIGINTLDRVMCCPAF